MQYSFSACDEWCSVFPWRHVLSASFDAVQVHFWVVEEGVEYADGVASPADTRNHGLWQLAFLPEDLSSGLFANDALEVADHCRVWMWAHYRPEEVVGVLDVCDPAPECFVDGVLECLGACLDRMDLSSAHFHPVDVASLSLHVLAAHADLGLQAESRAGHSS